MERRVGGRVERNFGMGIFMLWCAHIILNSNGLIVLK